MFKILNNNIKNKYIENKCIFITKYTNYNLNIYSSKSINFGNLIIFAISLKISLTKPFIEFSLL